LAYHGQPPKARSASSGQIVAYALASFVAHETPPKKPDIGKLCVASEEVGMGKNFFSLAFAAALLALASSEASAFAFVCQAVGVRSRAWGRSFYVVEAKLAALHRCARRSGICTISYCVPGY
jgi:hypothetical protein